MKVLYVYVLCASCSMFEEVAMGDHIVEAYSSMGQVMVLYVASNISFCLSHVVEVRALLICSNVCALVAVLYVNVGFSVRPQICRCMFMVSVVSVKPSCVLCSAGSVVNRVQVVLSRFRMRLLAFVHACTSCRYGSVYVGGCDGDVVCVCCGVGISEVYMLEDG